MPRIALAALLALVLAAAGCGGDDSGGGDSGAGKPAAGPGKLFADTCGGCHTLKAAKTEGQVGPNLDELGPDVATVKKAVETGPSVMPENLLDDGDLDQVAQYVADNAGK
jgi:mono/diheme cytochrome c family protein